MLQCSEISICPSANAQFLIVISKSSQSFLLCYVLSIARLEPLFINFIYVSIASDEKGKFDELVEEKGVRILVEPKALMHVIGTKMDFIDDKLRFGPLSHYKPKSNYVPWLTFYSIADQSLCSSIQTHKGNAAVVNPS